MDVETPLPIVFISLEVLSRDGAYLVSPLVRMISIIFAAIQVFKFALILEFP